MTRQRISSQSWALASGLVFGLASSLVAAGQVQDIPANWVSIEMRRLSVTEASASSAFSPEGGQYLPARAVDGLRGTKWVASIAPSPEKPQWIDLKLFGAQEVIGVAVFGEPVDNDGILDAQVQVAGSAAAEFTTVVAGLARTIATFNRDQQSLAERFSEWDALGEPARQSLVAQIERLEVGVERLISGLGQLASVWPEHAENLSAAREAADKVVDGEEVVTARIGTRLRLANHRVSVVLDEADGSWEATWLGSESAAVRRMQFAVEAGDHRLSSASARAEAAGFTDALGSGQEIRQRWGDGIEVDRCIRLYHGRPAVC